MADDAPHLWSSLRALAERSWRVPAENARRTTAHVGRVLQGEARAGDVLREAGRWAREEYRDYARDVAATGLELATAVVDLNLEYQRRFVERVFPAPPVPTLAVSGCPGQRLSIELTLDNDLEKAAIVRITPSALTAEGQAPVEEALTVEPHGFVLEPGEGRAVKVGVDLRAPAFAPGQRWQGELRIHGIGPDTRRVAVQVEVTAPTPAGS